MIQTLIILLVVVGSTAAILLRPAFIRWYRNRLKHRPFSSLWRAVIERTLPMYEKLSLDERKRLQGHIQVFLAEKQFIGCAGLQVTEEMKITISAIACLLLLNERGQYFPKLRSILIYPTAYIINETTFVENSIVEERREARLGEFWSADQVVLAWNTVKQDVLHWTDGHNVVLHEFAHQLDQEDGRAEGVPILLSHSDYAIWKQVMTQSYHQLCQDIERGGKTVMDRYGATNPAEFFAVATETFFEKPRRLLTHHPTLYEQLRHYYQLDPVQWLGR